MDRIVSLEKIRTMKELGAVHPELADMLLTLEKDLVELIDLRKDKARLDWLDSQDADTIDYGNGLKWQVWGRTAAYESDYLREAIDAAMEEDDAD